MRIRSIKNKTSMIKIRFTKICCICNKNRSTCKINERPICEECIKQVKQMFATNKN